MNTRELVEGLRGFDRLVELRASRFYAERRGDLERLLGTPLEGGPEGAPPPAPETLRLVQWNVEKGLRFEAVASALERHPELAGADVVFLNEVDLGMARSGNRHVARDLRLLRAHCFVIFPSAMSVSSAVASLLLKPGMSVSWQLPW